MAGSMLRTDIPAVEVEGLRHRYGTREALAGVSFAVRRGEIFGLLGPNGSGKTTLFKILSTLIPATEGYGRVFGHDLQAEPHAVRRCLGVVFQHPSLDPKLTVIENLKHHGHLYGLWGKALQSRAQTMLKWLELGDRAGDLVGTLSGGLQRRTELAKGLLHQPDLLLLDEPCTGLDPGARSNFSHQLAHLREQNGVTVVLTTHLLEEAERCQRVGILHQGKLVAVGAPDELKKSVGGDVVVIRSQDLEGLQRRVRDRFGGESTLIDGALRLERRSGHEFVREVVHAFPTEITSVTYGKPTLEDVFIRMTGHHFWNEGAGGQAS